MECFRTAGRLLNVDVRILTTDCAPALSAACQIADQCFAVPRCDHPSFVGEMLNICRTHHVDLLIPTIDPELGYFAPHRDQFSEVGTLAAVSDSDVVGIACNKLTTYRFFEAVKIPTPKTFEWSQGTIPDGIRFPVIVKPIEGSSSIGTEVFRAAERLNTSTPRQNCIVQEFWEGEEYTINLFFDRDRLRCAIPHLRLETRGGEVSKAITKRVEPLVQIATKLGDELAGRAFGALCFQAIISKSGDIVVLELNARFGGGYPLADYAGAKFCKWLLEISLGVECSANDHWEENMQMLRYDAGLFKKITG